MSLENVMVGPRGQVAHRALFESRPPRPPSVVEHAPGVASLLGLSVANAHALQGERGVIVFDSGHDEREGTQLLALLRSWTSRPISAVIYTHSHYCHGTGALAAAMLPDAPIIAHLRLEANLWRALGYERPAWQRRVYAQYGAFLPREGPDADPSEAERTHGRSASAYRAPTRLIVGPEETVDVDGRRLRFFTEFPWDTDDTLLVWDEAARVVIHNHVTRNFPNMYSIAGGAFRDPLPWLAGIDLMRRLKPAIALGTHGAPFVGETEVTEGLTIFRDALQFVFDQTIRGINRGFGPAELAGFVRLPAALADHPGLRQTYSELGFHVRAVFAGLFGWYGGDAAELQPLAPADEATRLVAALGGADAVGTLAERALADDDARWAARLARAVLWVDGANARAAAALAAALRRLGQRSASWTTRNALLTHARHWDGALAGGPDTRALEAPFEMSLETALLAPPAHFPRVMACCLLPERAEGLVLTCAIAFGPEDGITFRIRHGIAEVTTGAASEADLRLTMTRRDFLAGFLGLATWEDLLSAGRIQAGTSPTEVTRFFGLFEAWTTRGCSPTREGKS
jgi:alkyl sulfatase BDS1-like metallo-beta-lactamase superfamily hydrolase